MSDKYTVRYAADYEIAKENEGDGACDLRVVEEVTLAPFERRKVSTSLVLDQVDDTVALVLPRSGYSLRTGVTLINSPGLVDTGYRGEVQVSLVNLSLEEVVIEKGTRVAQLMIVEKANVVLERVSPDQISESIDGRGTGGYGSTGFI